MSRLLGLPREIRDEIMSILLNDALSRPLPEPLAVQRSNTRRDPHDLSVRKIRYPSDAPPSPAINALTLVNRQCYHESKDALIHHGKSGGSVLTLDVLVGENKWLFPTWIQVLPYAPRIKRVHVQLRPYVDRLQNSIDPHKGFVAWWHFGDLLNTLLTRGPDFSFARRCKPSIVEELVVEIVAGPSSTTDGEVLERCKTLRDFFVGHYYGLLTTKMKRNDAPWGPILLSRVETLVFKALGEHILTVDIREKAAALNVRTIELPEIKLVDRTRPMLSPKPLQFVSRGKGGK